MTTQVTASERLVNSRDDTVSRVKTATNQLENHAGDDMLFDVWCHMSKQKHCT